MRESLRLVAVAFQFLTRFPVRQIEVVEDDLRRAAGAFPLVGVVVAAAGITIRAAAAALWGPVVATVAAVAGMVAVTGALHEDGLADTVDGLWGGGNPSQRLQIMRDSRIGTYGTVTLVTLLALRISLLAPLDLADFARAVVCGHVLGRASTLVLVGRLPAAAPGLGARVNGPPSVGAAAAAAATVAAVVTVSLGPWAPVLVMVALVAVAVCARLLRQRLGGITGDALGATNQVVDLAALATVAALAARGWT